MKLRYYALTACLAILSVGGVCRGQMLPPALCVPYDTSDVVVPADKARAALAAFRTGNLRGVAQNLVGRDSVVGDPEQMPALTRGNGRLSRCTTIDSPDGFSESDLQWIDALGAFCDGDDLAAVQTARKLQRPGSSAEQFDRLRLETLVFLRRNMLPFAVESANQLASSNNPADVNLLRLVDRTAGAYRREKQGGWLRTWEAERSDSPQSPAIEFEFDGLLAVERYAEEASPAQRYRIVYRDLSGPPLVIAVCGPEKPDKQALVDSIQFPQYGEATFLLYPEEHEHSCTRVQLESLYAYSADLAPLAAGWINPDPLVEPVLDSDPVLYEEVVKPLQERKAWYWILRDRFGAGDLDGLDVDHKKFGEVDVFNFQYGPDGPPTWEVMAWENDEVPAVGDLAEEPLALEHMHFAVGTGRDRLHVASFRVVSRPAGSGRLYYLESIVNRQVAILDVATELPDFGELRNKVRDWVDSWPKPGGARALTMPQAVEAFR
jgi:hypothetical protein